MDKDEDFDAAFGEATLDNAEAAQAAAGDVQVLQADVPVAAEPAFVEPAPAPAPVQEDEPARLRQRLSTVQGILSRQGEELSRNQAMLKELQGKALAASAAAPAPAPAVVDGSDTLIHELESASPTVTRAVRALLAKERTAMERQLEDKFGKSVQEISGQIRPLQESAQTQAMQAQLHAIDSAHPGWQSVVVSSDFYTWTQNQPAYVQREMKRISEEGTADEVIEVLNSYQGASSAGHKSIQAGGDRRARQMAALGTVSTKPAATLAKGINRNDFDAAFAEAVAT
ncbi:MAG: hypothetical protein V4772_15620 [Pseudomonadota bacterium]